ncbi:winged helix DNA-binding domain-containing protein [Kitasatospora sp. YST-16]|uniref:winged helix DNA-binding domain-containing protein n=1 Tax=Kitasatospora sp. YST-16 TaxID=2998080 RepID=UPI0022844878|nr:winged helix DNA-binding domain-containing protein [Kitasatospora sp. YST-16]WAL75325.1 winged helix DNA-binding domain-containing protein [Kitasatospora sp. YST-16]WNW41385.1 winged helix DNA-binding domain-containing protein [Streptomyces sp. Li-HN-5-13]
MAVRPLFDDDQRRARLARRHRLAPGTAADRAEQVVDDLVAVHATDPATVFLAVAARLAAPGTADTERALYADGTVLRRHGMRKTLFVVPADLAPALYASTTAKAAAAERTRLLKDFAASGRDAAWTAGAQDAVLAALTAALPDSPDGLTGSQLGDLVPQLRESIDYGVGTSYQTAQPVGMRLLRLLGMEGTLVRRRPLGGWTSSRHRWVPGPPLPAAPSAAERAAAQAELAGRWLASHGPATEDDLVWWTGWGVREVRAALAACAAVEVELSGGATGFVLPDDLAPVADPAPWAALLPALDPTAMGWKHRDWYLSPEHRPDLVDRSGNLGPTAWWNGRIVGGWAQRPDGEVRLGLLTDPGPEARTALAAETAALRTLLADTRVTPRFRTPLERRLGD